MDVPVVMAPWGVKLEVPVCSEDTIIDVIRRACAACCMPLPVPTAEPITVSLAGALVSPETRLSVLHVSSDSPLILQFPSGTPGPQGRAERVLLELPNKRHIACGVQRFIFPPCVLFLCISLLAHFS